MNTSYLLNEDGGYFLLEDGGKLILSSPTVSEEFKIIVKDNAGVSLGEFERYRNLKFGKRLNDYGEAEFEIPVDNDKLSSLVSLRENTIYIYDKFSFEDGKPYDYLVWSGEQAKTDGKLQVNKDNWLKVISYTWFEQWYQRLTAFERLYTDTDAGEIAWSTIDESQRGVKNTGWHLPTASHSGGGFTTPDNAFVNDDTFAFTSVISHTEYWEDFNLNIPTGSVINGIEIKVKGKAAASNTSITLGVKSASAGSQSGQTVALGTANTEFTIGGSTELFSLTWTAADFADTNALVFVTTLVNSVEVDIDSVQIKVYYTVNDSDYDFGITRGTIESTTTRDRSYHNDIVAEKIKDLANVNSGFDFEITDSKIFNIYSTQGEDYSDSVVLEYGRNVKSVRILEDFKNPINKAIVLGSAYGEDDIQRVEVDDTVLQGVNKIREQKYTEMDEVDTLNFTDRGQALIAKYGTKLLHVDVDLIQSGVPIQRIGVGNLTRLIIKNNYHNISNTYRIFEWEISFGKNNARVISIVLGDFDI